MKVSIVVGCSAGIFGIELSSICIFSKLKSEVIVNIEFILSIMSSYLSIKFCDIGVLG